MEQVDWAAVLTMVGKIALIVWQAITAIVAVVAAGDLKKIEKSCNGNGGGKEVKKEDGRSI